MGQEIALEANEEGKSMRKATTRILGTALATLVLIASAHANAIFTLNGNASNSVNVTGFTSIDSMTLMARTSNAAAIPIRFTSTVNLAASGSGAGVAITAETGNIPSITISSPGFTFSQLEFNPETLDAASVGKLMISVLMSNGLTFQCPGLGCTLTSYGNNRNGNNRMLVSTAGGERILNVTITATAGTGFMDLKQVRFDGGTGGFEPAPVPEPGTLEGLLLGMGVIGLAEMGRRKLKLGNPNLATC
jgi:hypothetical protein